jgi:hypothetical protein
MKRTFAKLLSLTIVLSAGSIGIADEPATTKIASKRSNAKTQKAAEVKSVEMFKAMEDGLISVEYIGKDIKEANLIFKNKTGDALDIVLPATFGAVPVLAQGMGGMMGGMGGGGMGGMGGMGGGGMGGMGGGMGGMGGGQGMGGGMGGMGGGMGGMGGGGMGGMGGMGGGGMGGMFRVEADKTRKVSVATVCLEHGKHDPNPRMKYKIVRLSEVNDSPVVDELCRALANGKVSQNIAQAAAWHVANGLTWQELVQKPRVISQYTGVELYFSRYEVENAIRLVSLANQEAEKNQSYRQSESESSGVSVGEQLAIENKE